MTVQSGSRVRIPVFPQNLCIVLIISTIRKKSPQAGTKTGQDFLRRYPTWSKSAKKKKCFIQTSARVYIGRRPFPSGKYGQSGIMSRIRKTAACAYFGLDSFRKTGHLRNSVCRDCLKNLFYDFLSTESWRAVPCGRASFLEGFDYICEFHKYICLSCTKKAAAIEILTTALPRRAIGFKKNLIDKSEGQGYKFAPQPVQCALNLAPLFLSGL